MKRRAEFYLDEGLAERLTALAAKPGSSKTAIMADALKSYLDRKGASELEQTFKARLDRLSLALGRIERDLQVVAETLAHLVRYQLMVTAPLSEPDRTMRAQAQDRFQSFVEQVSRRISGGRSLTAEVLGNESDGTEPPS